MTMQVARGERGAALEVFQSVWLLTTAVSASFGLFVALGLWVLPIEEWLNLALLSRGQVSAILCVLCVYVLLDMQWTVIAVGFRCDGNYALGTLVGNIARFCANAASIVVVAFHASPLFVAATLVVGRLFGNWAGQIVLGRKSPWLHYGYRHAHFGVIKKLFSPAIAYMALTAGNSFIFQGMTILVSAALGPIAVVMFSTLRTLTRFAYQIVNVIPESILPELSSAFGSGNWLLARKIHRHACQAALGLSCAGTLFLLLFGGRVYGYWTHYRVAMDFHLFHILLLEVLVNSFWSTSSVVTISCNRHERQAVVYVAATALSACRVSFDAAGWVSWRRHRPLHGGPMHGQLCTSSLIGAPSRQPERVYSCFIPASLAQSIHFGSGRLTPGAPFRGLGREYSDFHKANR